MRAAWRPGVQSCWGVTGECGVTDPNREGSLGKQEWRPLLETLQSTNLAFGVINDTGGTDWQVWEPD